jgi:hypothetical protein
MEAEEEKAKKLAERLADLAKQAALRSALEGGRAGAFDDSAAMVREAFLSFDDPSVAPQRPQAGIALSGPSPARQNKAAYMPETRPVHGDTEVVLNILRTGSKDGLFFDEIDKLCRANGYRRPAAVLRGVLTRGVNAGQLERTGDLYRVIHSPPPADHE